MVLNYATSAYVLFKAEGNNKVKGKQQIQRKHLSLWNRLGPGLRETVITKYNFHLNAWSNSKDKHLNTKQLLWERLRARSRQQRMR